MFITFDPLIQYSQTRYHWIPWSKPSSHHMSSFFAPWWIFRHLGLCQKPSKCFSYNKFGSITLELGTHDLQATMCQKTYKKINSNSKPYGRYQPRLRSRQTGSKPISSPLTHHDQTWYIDPCHDYISKLSSMSGDTFRPPHVANELFLMLKLSKSIVHIHRPQIMSNHQTCHIWSSDQLSVKQLFQIQNRLAVTAN